MRKTRNKTYPVRGGEMTIRQAARACGIRYGTLLARMNLHGMTLEQAMDQGRRMRRHVPAAAWPVLGEMMTLRQASDRFGIPIKTLESRMRRRGCSLEAAVLDQQRKHRPWQRKPKHRKPTPHEQAVMAEQRRMTDAAVAEIMAVLGY